MGVKKTILKEGDNKSYPQKHDTLKMHYVGTLLEGKKTKFDSSRDKNKPFQFVIGTGQVIKGWDEGVIKMSIGELAILEITSDYGYGKKGAGGVIPPNAGLKFEVELLSINGVGKGGGCVIL